MMMFEEEVGGDLTQDTMVPMMVENGNKKRIFYERKREYRKNVEMVWVERKN